ncbi:MAG: HAD-IA family hydrolase [Arenicellales bacterium]|nr:HAD-IA family hydrolase [Arenicellales bacterium]MDP6792102.1 HAD-IA family hydrolase [Arenicellales bacterium]MDP6918255.1 HAD-IA family hydrolase [Arenicellales bacterium]
MPLPRTVSTAHCALFDLDGTLADTAPDLVSALNVVLVSAGRTAVPLKTARWWVAEGSVGLIQNGFAITREEARHSPLRQQLLEEYYANLCVKTRLFPGVSELLGTLDHRNIPWGIVTNKPARFTAPLLSKLKLDLRARSVLSGDSLSRTKPDPLPLLHACKEIGVAPSRTIFIGDDLRDVVAGKAAKIATVAVTWGYGVPQDAKTWGADHVVSSAWGILPILGLEDLNAQ